jgi:hypothetical protein
VEREPDAGVTLEGLEHRQVGPLVCFGDDPAEVADWLMVVEGQGKTDASHRRVAPHAVRDTAENHLDTGSDRWYVPKPVC